MNKEKKFSCATEMTAAAASHCSQTEPNGNELRPRKVEVLFKTQKP